ncbi:tetratricopeptide repeat protein [Streptosporangium sp. NPDC004631]
MGSESYRHPLAALRAQLGLSASEYLTLLDRRHRELGHGAMAIRREKVARWEAGRYTPELTAQLAIASLHGIAEQAVHELGWPDWLLLTFPDDRTALGAPWTLEGTVASMAASRRGGSMDRRGFLIATGATLGGIVTQWSESFNQLPTASAGRRTITVDTVTRLEQRLDDLRHLDDVLGGGELRQIATAELQLISSLADKATYTSETGRRLFTTVCEAARICGWQHFDAGRQAAAQKYFITALRASATAGDPEAGAHVLAFMAIQTYSVGNPQDAVNLVQTAQNQTGRRTTPRVRSMLHVRAARALSKTPHGRNACAHELSLARETFAQGSHDDDPPWTYWMTEGEIEMLAGACALDLGDPRQALRSFEAARVAEYSADGYVRDNALYLTRAAEAHFALGEIEEACTAARQAFEQSGGVDSTRPSGAIADLRKRLRPHRQTPIVRNFLELTA